MFFFYEKRFRASSHNKRLSCFYGCVSTSQKEDIFFDMSWAISKSSGLVQLDKLIPLEILYQDSHGSGNIERYGPNIMKALQNLFINIILKRF